MENRLKDIINAIEKVEYLIITQPFVLDGVIVKGEIDITVDAITLNFSVEIYPPYPFQYHGFETIRFINKELLTHDHVNADGSICVHTLHSPDLVSKISFDLNSLKHWVIKYFIKKEKDAHYEHIVAPPWGTGKTQALWFTEVEYQFSNGEFGQFHFSHLSSGNIGEEQVQTYILQDFKTRTGKVECFWNGNYKRLEHYTGIYLFVGEPPVHNGRFAVKNWQDLTPFVDQAFFKYLYDFEVNLKRNSSKSVQLKLIVGYHVADEEIHWQCINFNVSDFPVLAEKTGPKTYRGRFLNQSIDWMHTQNCSPKFFFGRGSLSDKLTRSRILVIGIGAVGSILCNTLIRGGCRNLFINDHDVKEADNVCRSEYMFGNGMVSKVFELREQLLLVSPFAEIQGSEELTDMIKKYRSEEDWQPALQKALDHFDYIFDCTTDNDLAYIFSQLNVKPEVINISITNHAKELVCVFKQDQYKWLMGIFNSLANDIVDLYNPTGCWSPTFKAGYNDIAVLVQFAIKHINLSLINDKALRNFYLATSDEEGFEIKLNLF